MWQHHAILHRKLKRIGSKQMFFLKLTHCDRMAPAASGSSKELKPGHVRCAFTTLDQQRCTNLCHGGVPEGCLLPGAPGQALRSSGRDRSTTLRTVVLVEPMSPGPAANQVDHVHGLPGGNTKGSLPARTLQPGVGTRKAGEEITGSWLMTNRIEELSASLDVQGSQEHHLIRALQALIKK